jgi:hypothetical protein
MTHTWEEAWRDLRALESKWPQERADLLFEILTDKDPGRIKRAISSVALDDALADKGLKLREMIENAREADIFDDVYHAAVHIKVFLDRDIMDGHSGERWLYRGENREYPATEARLHRIGDLSGRKKAIKKLTRFVDEAIEHWKWLTERQAIAIAQHYGNEEGVGLSTWLLDMTRDPYVALFFASLNGKDGDIGRVAVVDVERWKSMLGDVAVFETIRVPGVFRIRQQRALFLDSVDPCLLDDIAPRRIRFKQYERSRFIDTGLCVGEAFQLPLVDETLTWIRDWAKRDFYDRADALRMVPPIQTRVSLAPNRTPGLYSGIARGCIDPRTNLDAESVAQLESILEWIGLLHATVRLRVGHASIEALVETARYAAREINAARALSVGMLADMYRTNSSYIVDPSARTVYSKAVREVTHAWQHPDSLEALLLHETFRWVK